MANEDYKNGKIPAIIREFLNTGNRYEINGIDQSLAVFFYREENQKFKVIPKGSYSITQEASNYYLNISDENILSKAYQFQIIYIYEQISSSYIEEFPDLSIAVEKINNLVEDVKNIYSYLKSTGVIADTSTMTKVLPELEKMTVWYLNENGEMANLPISELYDKFQGLVNSLYREIKELLISDYDKFTDDMDSKTAELKKELENFEKDLEELLTALSNKEQEKINSLSTKVQGDISSAADTKKNEVITDIENAGDEEKKELNDHTLEKKKELDEYIDLNKESLIGPRGPMGYSIGAIKFAQDVPAGKEYDVFLENGSKLGTIMAPKGESIVGPEGPPGKDGTAVIVPVAGQYIFQIEDGNLVCYYEGDTAPNFTIEDGNLVLIIED